MTAEVAVLAVQNITGLFKTTQLSMLLEYYPPSLLLLEKQNTVQITQAGKKPQVAGEKTTSDSESKKMNGLICISLCVM